VWEYTLFYKNVIFRPQAQNFLINPDFSLKKLLVITLFPGSKLSYFFQFPEAYINFLKKLDFIVKYFKKYKCLVHQFSPYHENNKYFEATTQIYL